MSLLQAVERYLGGVDTWPSNIITYLFAETPSPRVVEELTTFFAGLKLSPTGSMACVIQKRQQNSCSSYYTRGFPCGTSNTVRRHSMYYDVRIKKHVRLNVSYFTELLAIRENAVAVPGWPAPKLRIANAATPAMINVALRLVSQKQL